MKKPELIDLTRRRHKVCLTLVAALAALTTVAPAAAHAAAPTVTRTWVTMYSYRYKITVTDPATYTAAGRDPNASVTTSGSCTNVYTKVRNISRYQNTRCTGPGTVQFQTPLLVPCETPFTIAADGVEVYRDYPNPTCPPPAPPAVVIARPDAATIVLTNPADIPQQATVQFNVAAPDSPIQADADITYWVTTNFAGTGPNTYVYYQGHVQVTLDPGQTVTVVTVPGDPELIGDTLYRCTGAIVSKPSRHCLGTWVPVA